MSAVDDIINYQRSSDEEFYQILNCTEQASVSSFSIFHLFHWNYNICFCSFFSKNKIVLLFSYIISASTSHWIFCHRIKLFHLSAICSCCRKINIQNHWHPTVGQNSLWSKFQSFKFNLMIRSSCTLWLRRFFYSQSHAAIALICYPHDELIRNVHFSLSYCISTKFLTFFVFNLWFYLQSKKRSERKIK